MKITIGDLRDMRGEDMPIILQNCKYTQGYAQTPIDGPWGWMVHYGDADPMQDNEHLANDDKGFHFFWDGLDYVEVDTNTIILSRYGIYVNEPTIWVEPTDTLIACETSNYYIRKALGDGYELCKWGECEPIAWYRTLEDAEDRYNERSDWNN